MEEGVNDTLQSLNRLQSFSSSVLQTARSLQRRAWEENARRNSTNISKTWSAANTVLISYTNKSGFEENNITFFTCVCRSSRSCHTCPRNLEIRVRSVKRWPSDPCVVVSVTSTQLNQHLLIRAHICPHKQLVVLCQRIPINHCGLAALLRNDARHGLAADLESPKLPKINAENICHDALLCVNPPLL